MTETEPSLEELMSEAAGLRFYTIYMHPTERWEGVTREDLYAHLLWIRKQEENGVLVLAGPLDRDLKTGAGLCVIRADSRDEAERISTTEPFGIIGLRKNIVCEWMVNEGSLNINIDLSGLRCSVH